MSYLTKDELLKGVNSILFDQLTQDSKFNDIDNTLIIEEAIEKADGIVDFYLSNRYVIPLTVVSKMIETVVFHLAVYFVYLRRYDDKMPETIKENRIWALDILEKIKDGKLFLEDATAKHKFNIYSNKASTDKVYNSDVMKTV